MTGATGFVGRTLVRQLARDGTHLIVMTRDKAKARALFGSGISPVEDLQQIADDTCIDAVVNLAGARVLGMPWTDGRREVLLQSRFKVTTAVIALIRRLHHRPHVLVSASAVGYYGDQRDATYPARSEASAPCPGQFASDLCVAIENEAHRAVPLGVRVVTPRFGVVMGQGGGAFPMLSLSARLGLGSVLGRGSQPAPWIHLGDAVALILFAMQHEQLSGPVNVVAPDMPTQAAFAQALAAAHGRQVYLRVPAAPLKLLLGEMANLLLEGENVVPQAALAAGYQFLFPSVEQALTDLLGSPSHA